MLIICSCSSNPDFHTQIKNYVLRISVEKDINIKMTEYEPQDILKTYNPSIKSSLVEPHIIFLDELTNSCLSTYELGHILQMRYHYSLYITLISQDFIPTNELFAIKPWGFQKKPLTYEETKQTILSIYSDILTNSSQDYLYVLDKTSGYQQILLQKDIVAIELVNSSTRTIYLHLANGKKIMTTGRLNFFENRLNAHFFKIYRSIIVNLNYIVEFSTEDVFLVNKLKLPVSKAKYSKLMNAYSKLLRHHSSS